MQTAAAPSRPPAPRRSHQPRVPPPDPSNETLATRARGGDENALNTLISRNYPLIVHAATRARLPAGMERQDLIQEAALAMMRAVRYWDPGRGRGFASYAYFVMKRELATLERETAGLLRIPATTSLNRVGAERTRAAARRAWTARYELPSPNLSDEGWREIEKGIIERDLLEWVLGSVPEREAVALRMRAEGRKLREIGRALGVSRERVRQVIEEAAERVRGLSPNSAPGRRRSSAC